MKSHITIMVNMGPPGKKKANKQKSLVSLDQKFGAPGRIRTCGTRIRNPDQVQ